MIISRLGRRRDVPFIGPGGTRFRRCAMRRGVLFAAVLIPAVLLSAMLFAACSCTPARAAGKSLPGKLSQALRPIEFSYAPPRIHSWL